MGASWGVTGLPDVVKAGPTAWQDDAIRDAQEVRSGLDLLESVKFSEGARLLVKVTQAWTDSIIDGRLVMTPCVGNPAQFHC